MKIATLTCLALSLASARAALAEESEEPRAAAPALAPCTADVNEHFRCGGGPVPAAHDDAKAATGEEPAVGWRRGKRAPIYLNAMLLGQGLVEDDENRLTTRREQTIEGVGGLLRLGGLLNEHSRIGMRMQWFFRPTKKILQKDSTVPTGDNPWGAVMFGYAGPEYLYTTHHRLYFGGSAGLAGVASHERLEDCDDDSGGAGGSCDDDLEHGALGAAAVASLGYEWRVNKWFAMNAEAFAGVYRGFDDNERAMDGAVFGIGVGLGF